jgi:serine/threonine protein kinase
MKLSTEQQLDYALKIAEGVEYLHSRKAMIVHCDLKSSNILVKNYSFVLASKKPKESTQNRTHISFICIC